MSAEPLLSVDGLTKYFDPGDSVLDRLFGTETPPVRAVDGVTFDIPEGETFGLVGESGCGKSTTGQTILRLLEPTAGHAYYRGQDVDEMDGRGLNEFRRNAQIVFQDPFSSLNPRMTVGNVVREPLKIHGVGTKASRREKVQEMLQHVGLSADHVDRYPHEFSGGQRQRICIARALALEPDLIVLDEPVSSLDVSVQAQILNLLNDLQAEFDLTYLFIAHDLGVVKYICDRVGVMYLGRLVETGPTATVFDRPQHPYTEALLESIPKSHLSGAHGDVEGLDGEVPSPRTPPAGCSFHTRCKRIIRPPGMDLGGEAFRTVMNFRYQLATDTERFEEYLADGSTDSSDEEVARHAADLRDAFDVGETLPDPDAERAVDEATRAIVTGDDEGALDRLDETFTTVCRAHAPDLVEGTSDDHHAACFLAYEDPPAPTDDAATNGHDHGDGD